MATDKWKRANTWDDVDSQIAAAVRAGILLDKRAEMPRGTWCGQTLSWRRNRRSPRDVMGHCLHQNGSRNSRYPLKTAVYHTSTGNHVTPGRAMPSTVYAFMIPDTDDPPWLTGDLRWITYAQGSDAPGDENRHLLPILVMGGFFDNGFERPWTKLGPSDAQIEKLEALVVWTSGVFGYSGEGYYGHYHFGKSACPGLALKGWTERQRNVLGHAELRTDLEWQQAILRWDPAALPVFGADGQWGGESKYWLTLFQRGMGIRETGLQDPFSEMLLIKYFGYTDSDLMVEDPFIDDCDN